MAQHSKSEALVFLQTLHAQLDINLPATEAMRGKIGQLIDLGKTSPEYRHLCSPEHAFTRGIALPRVHEELTGTFGLSADDAREALLAEGWANFRSISSGTPARTVSHPFDKTMVSEPQKVYLKWTRKTDRHPLTYSCPDFALRSPSPHKVVFEAKYFSGGTPKQAEKELVEALYQAFFYRALPPTNDQLARSWDYDYACLFAFDASPDGALKNAWETLDAEVKDGFWNGANVYVMLLTGSPT